MNSRVSKYRWACSVILLFCCVVTFSSADYKTLPELPWPKTNSKAQSMWSAMLPYCSVVIHIKIPKTGSTSVMSVLKSSDHFEWTGRNIMYQLHGKESEFDQFIRGDKKKRSPLIMSVEWGIDDLRSAGYKYFNETCFFTG